MSDKNDNLAPNKKPGTRKKDDQLIPPLVGVVAAPGLAALAFWAATGTIPLMPAEQPAPQPPAAVVGVVYPDAPGTVYHFPCQGSIADHDLVTCSIPVASPQFVTYNPPGTTINDHGFCPSPGFGHMSRFSCAMPFGPL